VRDEIVKLRALVGGVRDPVPAILDRLGLRRSRYELVHNDGHRVELRPRAGDLYGFFEIMLRGDYLSAGQRIGQGATVIDVGANIGCFSILASRAVGPHGRVIAIEPEMETYRQLVRNIQLNALVNIVPLRLAIAGEEGTATLHSDRQALFSSIFSSVDGRVVHGTDQDVRTTTLETVMQEQEVSRCDYLKLDCEGAEHGIVQTLSPTLAGRIMQITMEVHEVPGFRSGDLSVKLERVGFERIAEGDLSYYARV
jgi:FkbM family methyltransferase